MFVLIQQELKSAFATHEQLPASTPTHSSRYHYLPFPWHWIQSPSNLLDPHDKQSPPRLLKHVFLSIPILCRQENGTFNAMAAQRTDSLSFNSPYGVLYSTVFHFGFVSLMYVYVVQSTIGYKFNKLCRYSSKKHASIHPKKKRFVSPCMVIYFVYHVRSTQSVILIVRS
jgi:hypothetical protein